MLVSSVLVSWQCNELILLNDGCLLCLPLPLMVLLSVAIWCCFLVVFAVSLACVELGMFCTVYSGL